MRIDLHCHSSVSQDGWMSPLDLVEAAVSTGLDKVAITDHREIDGAIEAHRKFPERVIVGEEIHCDDGTHIIGLFLTELIESGQAVAETIRTVRAQGGLVYAPHPFAYAWGAQKHADLALADADVVEVFNSRAFLPGWNRRAAAAAAERGLPGAASSDAHFPWEFGRAYTELRDFSDAEGFISAIQNAHPVGHRLGAPWLHVASRLIAETRRFSPTPARAAVRLTPAMQRDRRRTSSSVES